MLESSVIYLLLLCWGRGIGYEQHTYHAQSQHTPCSCQLLLWILACSSRTWKCCLVRSRSPGQFGTKFKTGGKKFLTTLDNLRHKVRHLVRNISINKTLDKSKTVHSYTLNNAFSLCIHVNGMCFLFPERILLSNNIILLKLTLNKSYITN